MLRQGLGPKWEDLQNRLWPEESHGIESDCPNPYCDASLQGADWEQIEWTGKYTCPKCGWETKYSEMTGRPRTRAGLTLEAMGRLGEDVVRNAVQQGLPLGQLVWDSPGYQDPIDMVIGNYAIEVKTLHSESYPRAKIGGVEGGKRRVQIIQDKLDRTRQLSQQLGMQLQPGMLAVRLNFYKDTADIFFSPDFKDRMLTAMQHLGQYDFSDLNPFKDHVPTPDELPDQGETGGSDDLGL